MAIATPFLRRATGEPAWERQGNNLNHSLPGGVPLFEKERDL